MLTPEFYHAGVWRSVAGAHAKRTTFLNHSMFVVQIVLALLAITVLIATVSLAAYGAMWSVLLLARWLPLVGRRHQRGVRTARLPIRSTTKNG